MLGLFFDGIGIEVFFWRFRWACDRCGLSIGASAFSTMCTTRMFILFGLRNRS